MYCDHSAQARELLPTPRHTHPLHKQCVSISKQRLYNPCFHIVAHACARNPFVLTCFTKHRGEGFTPPPTLPSRIGMRWRGQEGGEIPPPHRCSRGAQTVLRGPTHHNSARGRKSGRSGPFDFAQGRRDDESGERRNMKRGTIAACGTQLEFRTKPT